MSTRFWSADIRSSTRRASTPPKRRSSMSFSGFRRHLVDQEMPVFVDREDRRAEGADRVEDLRLAFGPEDGLAELVAALGELGVRHEALDARVMGFDVARDLVGVGAVERFEKEQELSEMQEIIVTVRAHDRGEIREGRGLRELAAHGLEKPVLRPERRLDRLEGQPDAVFGRRTARNVVDRLGHLAASLPQGQPWLLPGQVRGVGAVVVGDEVQVGVQFVGHRKGPPIQIRAADAARAGASAARVRRVRIQITMTPSAAKSATSTVSAGPNQATMPANRK